MKKSSIGILLALLLLGMPILTLRTQLVSAIGTVHIRVVGSIEPATAPIQRDRDVYTLTDNIYGSVVVERDGIVVDGRGFAVQGGGSNTGIDLSYRSNVTLRNVKVTGFDVGISLLASNNCTLLANCAYLNRLRGIDLATSNNNILASNTVSSNEAGIVLSRCRGNVLTGNTAFNNSLGGILFWYSSANALVRNNAFLNNQNIHWYFMRAGFFFFTSDNNTATGNTGDSNGYGFFLTFSNNNSFISNVALNNSREGIYVYYSTGNSFAGNIVSDNWCGVGIEYADDNSFFHNNFLDNAAQVRRLDGPSSNEWDDGYPSGGNYWSDYVATDDYSGVDQNEPGSDGIFDDPYVIDADNIDNYPVAEPWTPLPETIDELKTRIEELGACGQIDNRGIVRSLVAKLDVAQKLVDKGRISEAKKVLEDDFILQVQHLSRLRIAVEAADIIIESTEYILSHL